MGFAARPIVAFTQDARKSERVSRMIRLTERWKRAPEEFLFV